MDTVLAAKQKLRGFIVTDFLTVYNQFIFGCDPGVI